MILVIGTASPFYLLSAGLNLLTYNVGPSICSNAWGGRDGTLEQGYEM
jgi:hypothetical protein